VAGKPSRLFRLAKTARAFADEPGYAVRMLSVILIGAYVLGSLLALTVVLHLLPKLGRGGRAVANMLCRAPALDVTVSIMTWVPGCVGAGVAGWYLGVSPWLGVLSAVVGQLVALSIWVVAHEWANREAAAGPRIVKALNRTVGRWRNHAALWVTVIALPIFWFIRAGELFVYPMLVWILDFPKYKQGDWVNCSRQKFQGLVGHDLIWCLYCDWMTGVYSLGGEMLRNVESFWCPIRFYDGKKCDNCNSHFPDVNGGWVKADGTMTEVEGKLNEMYAGGRREWFNHPDRLAAAAAVALTVGGQSVVAPVVAAPPESQPPATDSGRSETPGS